MALVYFLSTLRYTISKPVSIAPPWNEFEDRTRNPNFWRDMTFWISPARIKLEELAPSRIQKTPFVFAPLLYAAYRTVQSWIPNYNSGKLVIDFSGFSDIITKTFLPNVFKYQAILATMSLYQKIASRFVSRESLYRLSLHPYHRSIDLGKRDPDKISLLLKVISMSLWSNLLYYAANYTVHQISLCHEHYKEYYDHENAVSTINSLIQKSWELLYTQSRRYYYSAIGAGFGSILLPGWGALMGQGISNVVFAQDTPIPDPPFSSLLVGWFQSLEPYFASSDNEQPSYNNATHDDARDELLRCGCCQVNYFVSDHPLKTPISSRACNHTICKSCVAMCHMATLQKNTKSHPTKRYIKCPLCSVDRAFYPKSPLINQSLCDAMAVMEKSHHVVPRSTSSASIMDIPSVMTSFTSYMSDDDDVSEHETAEISFGNTHSHRISWPII